MANIERGTRIKERREELHLTQPAVVELLEQAAKELPPAHDLHPAKAGKAPVTLRGYQSYEQGGGIIWEKAKLLAHVLQMDVQAMMTGTEEPAPTPSPFPGKLDDARVLELLENVQQLVTNQNELLERQSAILERIEAAIDREDQAATREAESARRLEEAVHQARSILQAGEPHPAPAPKTRAKSGNR